MGFALTEPPGYFDTLIEFSSCCIFAYCAWHLIKKKEWEWAWCYGGITLFLNPFIPIHIREGSDAWGVARLAIIVLIISKMAFDSNKKKKDKKNDPPKKELPKPINIKYKKTILAIIIMICMGMGIYLGYQKIYKPKIMSEFEGLTRKEIVAAGSIELDKPDKPPEGFVLDKPIDLSDIPDRRKDP